MRKQHWTFIVVLALMAQGVAVAAKKDKTEAQAPPQPPRIVKKRIAVMPVDVQIEQWNWAFGPTSITGGLTEMATTALVDTDLVVVVERAGIGDILSEQQLAEEGVTTKETGAQKGRVIGAEYLVRGALTEFEYAAEGGGGGVAIRGFRIGGSKSKARLGLDVRVYNSSTSQVISSEHVTGSASRSATAVGASIGSIDVHADAFKKTPLGSAMRDAVDKWVAFVVQVLGKEPWRGRIVKVDGDKVYINAGSELGIQAGDVFEVWHEGEALVDPETGLELGRESEKVGTIQVITVAEKYAIAQAVEGETFERGDLIMQMNFSAPE